MIDDQYNRAKKILEDNISALHASAEALLEHETIEGKHVHEILEHGKILSPVITSKPDETDDLESGETSAPKDAEEEKGDDVNPGGEPAGAPA